MEENDALSMFDAGEDWNWARRKVLYQEVVCFFKQCSVDLLSFEDVRSGLHLSSENRSRFTRDSTGSYTRQCWTL